MHRSSRVGLAWLLTAAVELFPPRQEAEGTRAGVEMPAPFALPAGTVELLLSTGGSKVQVTGTRPVRAAFAPR